LPIETGVWEECGTVCFLENGMHCFIGYQLEELIRTRQQEYYDALGKSDMEVDSSTFVELC